MTLISFPTLIRALSVFHITLAYFFLASPKTVAEQSMVFILGESMHLPAPSSFEQASPATGFIAVLLAMLAISDFTAAALPPEISLRYWGAQLPVRLAFFFALTAFSYVLTPSSTLSSRVAATDHLKNRLVFSAGFMELALWYYAYLLLRQQRVTRVERPASE